MRRSGSFDRPYHLSRPSIRGPGTHVHIGCRLSGQRAWFAIEHDPSVLLLDYGTLGASLRLAGSKVHPAVEML